MQVAKARGQSAPLATVLRDIEDRVYHLKIADRDVATLYRQERLDATELSGCDFLAAEYAGQELSLTVTANGGTDLVTGAPADFRLKAALVRPSSKVLLNLNPFSTFMVDIAGELRP